MYRVFAVLPCSLPQGSAEAAALHREEELLRLSRALSDAHATIDLLHTRWVREDGQTGL